MSTRKKSNYGFPSKAAAKFPSCVQLTLVHYICDSGCISCPVGQLNQGDPQARAQWEADGGNRGYMAWNVFAKAAVETGQHPESFMRFHARGEPTLHPRFIDMLSFAKKAGVETIQVFTNGISMDEDLARQTLETGVDVMEFSVHGHAQTYEEVMGNPHFDRVVENVLGFVRLRNELGKPTKVVVSAVDQPAFQPEKGVHHRFWAEHADQVILRPYHSWGGRIAKECANLPEQRQPCPQFWTRLTIGPTGNILYCFNSWDEDESEVVANLMEPDLTIASVWQSSPYLQARAAHLEGNYAVRCCANCTDWVGSSWGENSYETLLENLDHQSPAENC